MRNVPGLRLGTGRTDGNHGLARVRERSQSGSSTASQEEARRNGNRPGNRTRKRTVERDARNKPPLGGAGSALVETPLRERTKAKRSNWRCQGDRVASWWLRLLTRCSVGVAGKMGVKEQSGAPCWKQHIDQSGIKTQRNKGLRSDVQSLSYFMDLRNPPVLQKAIKSSAGYSRIIRCVCTPPVTGSCRLTR